MEHYIEEVPVLVSFHQKRISIKLKKSYVMLDLTTISKDVVKTQIFVKRNFLFSIAVKVGETMKISNKSRIR